LDPNFDWEPLRTDAVLGKSTELRCRPPIGNPYPKVSWLKDGQSVEINRSGRFILSGENSLLIGQVKQSDSGNYTCVAENIAGKYSSEPAELIIHDDLGWSDWLPFSECKGIPCGSGRQRRIRTCLNPPTITNRPSCDGDQIQERECLVACPSSSSQLPEQAVHQGIVKTDEEFSDWFSWSECKGNACNMGHQQRIRVCLKLNTKACDGERVQERECFVPCSTNSSDQILSARQQRPINTQSLLSRSSSNWTAWSLCNSDCQMIRTRQCSNQQCVNSLETKPCKGNLCPSIPILSSKALNIILYSSAGVGCVILLILLQSYREEVHHQKLIINRNFIHIYENREPRLEVIFANLVIYFVFLVALPDCITSKTTNDQVTRDEYPFYYSIQQDTTSTRSCASQNASLTHSESIEKEKLLLNLNESSSSPGSNLHHQLYAHHKQHQQQHLLNQNNNNNTINTSTSVTANGSSIISGGGPFHLLNYCGFQPKFHQRSIQNNDYSHTSTDTTSRSTPSSILNSVYEKILQSLPQHTDLRYFAVSVLNSKGCKVQIANTGVCLVIPEQAVLDDEEYLIFIAILTDDMQMPQLSEGESRLSPVVLIGPSEITLLKPAVLSFEHTALLDDNTWQLSLMSGEFNDTTNILWRLESMGAYTLVGESLPNKHASKYIQMVTFYNRSLNDIQQVISTLRLRFIDNTSDALERCLSEETSMQSFLCEQPKLFLLQDSFDQICVNVDMELSISSRINMGYKEIPLEMFWSNHIDRACFIFVIPGIHPPNIEHIAIHIDIYQPHILPNALHTRICINTMNLHQNSPLEKYNTSTVRSHYLKQTQTSTDGVFRLPQTMRQKLCEVLDPPNLHGNDWRMFAQRLHVDHYLHYFATKVSPTEHLLTLWEARHSQDPLTDIINLLNQMGRSDAAKIIISGMNIGN
ncbi:unnamed protein product, partial [Didymodactylos carnosus]